ILWERLWPALARIAVVIGLFLTVSWLGFWLLLPPLGRAAGLVAFLALAVAAIISLAFLRLPVAGWPSPRLSVRDPYAVRGLVLMAVIATFIAAGGERWRRVSAAFDWQGVVL